jgi:hypothetical protein
MSVLDGTEKLTNSDAQLEIIARGRHKPQSGIYATIQLRVTGGCFKNHRQNVKLPIDAAMAFRQLLVGEKSQFEHGEMKFVRKDNQLAVSAILEDKGRKLQIEAGASLDSLRCVAKGLPRWVAANPYSGGPVGADQIEFSEPTAEPSSSVPEQLDPPTEPSSSVPEQLDPPAEPSSSDVSPSGPIGSEEQIDADIERAEQLEPPAEPSSSAEQLEPAGEPVVVNRDFGEQFLRVAFPNTDVFFWDKELGGALEKALGAIGKYDGYHRADWGSVDDMMGIALYFYGAKAEDILLAIEPVLKARLYMQEASVDVRYGGIGASMKTFDLHTPPEDK